MIVHLNNIFPINRARSRLKIVSGQVSLLLLVTVLLVSGWHALDTNAVGHAAELEIDGSWELARTAVAPEAALPNLNAFVRSVQNGSTGTLAGVYVPGKWAYSISQQPPSNPGFVSSNPEAVTQFGLAAQYNTIGLLAHNYLAGSSFFELDKSNKAALIYGDGSVKYFLIEGIDRYRALSPNSPYSSFEDLQNPGVIISVTELFNRIYAPGDRLVLQTCIESNGNLSWGRLFITASPIDYPVKISYNYRPEKFRLD